MRHKLLVVSFLFALGACAPKLGDGCKTSTDCSVQGDRICDRAQPGGYCTVADCTPGSCGSEGRCVRFQPDEPRRSRDWCMKRCGNGGDCTRNNYVCRSADQLNEEHAGMSVDGDAGTDVSASDLDTFTRVAEVLDGKKNAKFCVVKPTYSNSN